MWCATGWRNAESYSRKTSLLLPGRLLAPSRAPVGRRGTTGVFLEGPPAAEAFPSHQAYGFIADLRLVEGRLSVRKPYDDFCGLLPIGRRSSNQDRQRCRRKPLRGAQPLSDRSFSSPPTCALAACSSLQIIEGLAASHLYRGVRIRATQELLGPSFDTLCGGPFSRMAQRSIGNARDARPGVRYTSKL